MIWTDEGYLVKIINYSERNKDHKINLDSYFFINHRWAGEDW